MNLKLLFVLLISLCTAPRICAEAADVVEEPKWGAADVVEAYTVGPGIKYQKIIYPDMPLILWYTEIDLTNPLNKIEQAQSRNQVPDVLRWDIPTFSKQNSREGHNVRVAWNHDFFSYDQGICIGNNISNGELTWTKWGRSLLAITKEGKAEVFNPNNIECKATTADNTAVEIDRYNKAALSLDGDCVLFNRMNSETLTAGGKYIKIIPQGEWTVNGAPIPCKVAEISDSPIQTSATEYVLYLRGAKLNALDGHIAVGENLTITQRFNGAAWGNPPANILNAFHGYPSIAHDGVFHDGEYNNFESGREYENSSHVMVGISKDKTKLYVLINEMSANSKAVDCVKLTSWMILRGAWDVVNFDSGGSAAIAIDDEMLNLPGRGSVRPVEDAMLAISLAPTDNTVHHIAFSKFELAPSVISLTPLRVMAFNQYDEVLNKDLSGCTFRCEPESLGYVDDNAIFHSSGKGMSGKIFATKDDLIAEIPVTTKPANRVYPKWESILIDNHRKYLIEIMGATESETFNLDASAFSWASSDPTVCNVKDGLITVFANGKSTLTANFEDVTFNIDVTVEIAEETRSIAEFANAADFTIGKSSVSNIELLSAPLPSTWKDGNVIKFDLTAGRSAYMKFSMNKALYSLPDSVSLQLDNSNGVVKTITVVCKDNLGTQFSNKVDITDAADIEPTLIRFNTEGTPFEVARYPISLQYIQFTLDPTKAAKELTLPVRAFNARYPKGSGVESIISSKTDNQLDIKVNTESVDVNFNCSLSTNATISMYSTTGRLLHRSNVTIDAGNNSININTKEALTGFYLIAIDTPYGSISGKCIIK
ncbi:MAG: phosphodiester glycosidase family protein [Muribaculaceae bacterium]|nr:phosphodiester glycosidase family protein [Muribaculaceae bacterium]